MNPRQITNLIDQVFTTAHNLGATVPKPLAAERQKLADLAAAVRFLDVPSDVSGAVLDALADGKDPVGDPRVRDAVIGREISATNNGIADRLGARAAQFLTEHTEELLSMFLEPFDRAASTLTEASASLGDLDLDDTAAVVARGGDAAKVWAAAQGAEQTIASIVSVYKLIATTVASHRLDARYRLLLIADIEPTAYLEQGLNTASAHVRPFDLVRRGHRLSLATTPAVLAERVAAVQQTTRDGRTLAEGEFKRTFRRLHGSGVPL